METMTPETEYFGQMIIPSTLLPSISYLTFLASFASFAKGKEAERKAIH
jgi:hypothetical protein